jgi:hypothetical protein
MNDTPTPLAASPLVAPTANPALTGPASPPTAPAPWAAPYPYAGPPPRPRKVYETDRFDGIWALVAVGLGFLFWNWLMPRQGEPIPLSGPEGHGVAMVDYYPAVAVTAFFLLAMACSLVYFRVRKLVPSRSALLGALLLVAGLVPYTLYDTTPLHFLAGPVVVVGYALWHAYAARTAVAPTLSALTSADVLNQGLVVPFSNAGSWFRALRGLARDGRRGAHLIVAVVGLVLALPVIAVVLLLLASADQRFDSWVSGVGDWLVTLNAGRFLGQFSLGLPLAIGLFASWYGNARHLGTEVITARRAQRWAESARRIPRVGLVAPVAVLCAIYLVFFAAMGSYLFSAFAGHLPADFTYAVYARQGFFQLVAVAAINLVVLGFMYLLGRREADRYPPVLRVLGAVLVGLTLLMVAVAASKMVMYVEQFGLSQLRLYTLWFMGLLLVVFGVLMVWHVRAFRASIPIVWVALASFLGLTWANTDGVIADYNASRYLSGQVGTVDVDYLADTLSDAAVPALVDLRDQASDPLVRSRAAQALEGRFTDSTRLTAPYADAPWTSWNWQASRAGQLLGE